MFACTLASMLNPYPYGAQVPCHWHDSLAHPPTGGDDRDGGVVERPGVLRGGGFGGR
jgi:hypothetical protein